PLPTRGEVQNEVRDVRLQRRGEPRRRIPVAGRLRAEGVDCHRRGKDQRAREESGELRTDIFRIRGGVVTQILGPKMIYGPERIRSTAHVFLPNPHSWR